MNEMTRPSRRTVIRYFKGESLPDESKLVELYLYLDTDNEYVESCIEEVWDELGVHAKLHTDDNDLKYFKEQLDQKKRTILQLPPLNQLEEKQSSLFRVPLWIKTVAAALLLIGGSVLVLHNIKFTSPEKQVAEQENSTLPGSDKALLTLADGSTISLAEAENGEIAAQEGLLVEKTSEGEIVYRYDNNPKVATNAYNSIVTPKGGQYKVTLPDGSTAWLNAASSLTYPIRFSKTERRVTMKGEVYFEIAKVSNDKNDQLPFYVETDNQEIEVLGTHFNVNAYADESFTSTTLIEGSVRVTTKQGDQSVLLRPGQEARMDKNISVHTVDTDVALAWKSGDFYFNNEELSSVLRKLARWYDVDVKCPPTLDKVRLTGIFSRNQTLSSIVESLGTVRTVKIKFSTKERRIVVEE